MGERRQFRMQVFRNDYFESLRVPPTGLGYPRAPSRVTVVGGQVGQVRLGQVRNPHFRTIFFFKILAFEIVGRCQMMFSQSRAVILNFRNVVTRNKWLQKYLATHLLIQCHNIDNSQRCSETQKWVSTCLNIPVKNQCFSTGGPRSSFGGPSGFFYFAKNDNFTYEQEKND